MSCKSFFASSVLLSLALTAPSARADPQQDLVLGGDIHVLHYGGRVGEGRFNGSDVLFRKTAGSLDFTVDTRALGLPFDHLLTLRGSMTGNVLTWRFAERLEPARWADGAWVSSIEGTVSVIARLVGGDTAPRCIGGGVCPNVYLTVLPGSQVRVVGTKPLGLVLDETAQLTSLAAYGGLPRPALARLSLRLPGGAVCSNEVTERVVTGEVELTSPAPNPGTWVELSSSAREAVRVAGVMVAGGRTRAIFSTRILPGYRGEVQISAAAGGAQGAQRFVVRPPDVCALAMLRLTELLSAVDTFGGVAPGPIAAASFNDLGDAVIATDHRQVLALRDGSWFDLNEKLGAARPVVSVAAGNGGLLGTVASGEHQGYGFTLARADDQPVFLKGVVPAALNEFGSGTGTLHAGGHTRAVGFHGGLVVKLATPGLWSAGVDINGAGAVLGHYGYENEATGLFCYDAGQTYDLGTLGGEAAQAVALNESGAVLGRRKVAGAWRGFVYLPATRKLRDLRPPSGFLEAQPMDLDEDGVVVGSVSRDGTASHAAIWLSDGTPLLLAELLPTEQKLHWLAATRITADGRVLVRAAGKQEGELFLAKVQR